MTTQPLHRDVDFPQVIGAVQEFRSIGIKPETIEQALINKGVPENLAHRAEILSRDMPNDYRLTEYRQQLLYPSYPNP